MAEFDNHKTTINGFKGSKKMVDEVRKNMKDVEDLLSTMKILR